ncbi:tRNA (adenosine(37)-N6)-dimethylallyltransferase MiaA [Pelolinea submarina]|uniref:tRNA dimethylallyltransferase n=1 Tax=Pelolinea submarina TaxID=913107 RepID=A0A347ZTV8_9CHLR|nr:tRNA (adenosine(37)-N6)-dimethylallyltransferase MiaA [Pelolinea submarina]REG10680.1 tRNA dimethylallyltransferase [Pelolinea submarina]BBB48739.1 tRNA dimethylallyltransferase [Pelolinea submarina]
MRYPVEKPVVLLVGPTAVGKTALSLELAGQLNAEIISADSRLFYRGMDIGTAKPSLAERGDIPHHLIDVADPDETWSLALFQREAKAIIADIQSRGKLPLVVGGTGQYVRAITEGWQVPAQQPDAGMRAALESWAEEIGGEALHQRLALLDPNAAAAIDWRNQRRTVRALEVIFNTGRCFSAQRIKGSLPYQYKLIGLKRDRPELYERVDMRIEKMLADGFEAEVRGLLEKGYSADAPALSAIGYREMIEYVQGKISLEEAVMLIKRRTRLFVRRQANWFKESDPRIRWFDAAQDNHKAIIDFIMSGEGWQNAEGK